MKYEGQICRPPMEKASFMLPVAVGCSYNACTFCTLFKHLKYRQLPPEQIEAEMKRVFEAGGNPKTIFLGDGNAFGLSMDDLRWILRKIKEYFPACSSVNMDATITNISQKSDEELEELYNLGVRRLYIGVETGLDDVLSFVKKDHNLQQAYVQIARMQKANLIFCSHIMTGIAGKGRGLENAAATAEFFNKTKPERIVNFNIFHHRSAPLFREIESGNYIPADEQENLHEERKFVELLDIPVVYDAFHDCLELRFKGVLPNDKQKILDKIDKAIAYWDEQPSYVKFFR